MRCGEFQTIISLPQAQTLRADFISLYGSFVRPDRRALRRFARLLQTLFGLKAWSDACGEAR